ncbi:hypothetical protein NHL51_11790 [Leucobacter sp. gxy201]|uniref:hypothetical protein n=1 Tax=Leucobacter sp. gxy201 TaxID=2957200 RepID=UPI003DA1BF4D
MPFSVLVPTMAESRPVTGSNTISPRGPGSRCSPVAASKMPSIPVPGEEVAGARQPHDVAVAVLGGRALPFHSPVAQAEALIVLTAFDHVGAVGTNHRVVGVEAAIAGALPEQFARFEVDRQVQILIRILIMRVEHGHAPEQRGRPHVPALGPGHLDFMGHGAGVVVAARHED